jgi:hypothetical protein
MRGERKTSGLWSGTSTIPSIKTFEDTNGRESSKFGAVTSGQTLLYAAAGRLRFNSGITISRGHSGPNDGLDAVVDIIEGRTPRLTKTPVFGCSLLGPNT